MIVPARECHVCQMTVAGLRAADEAEVRAASGMEPGAAMLFSFTASKRVYASVNEQGVAHAIFGVAEFPDTRVGCPWMLGTREMSKYRKELLRLTPQYMAKLGRGFSSLTNYVDARNTQSIRWLTWAGFKFDPPAPFGFEGKPFLRFTKDT